MIKEALEKTISEGKVCIRKLHCTKNFNSVSTEVPYILDLAKSKHSFFINEFM